MILFWIKAMRLRTLPLACSGIILGSLLTWNNGFTWGLFLLFICTAVALQILSNFANDYGDFTKGTDNANRTGEARMVSSGKISSSAMRNAIFIFALLSFFLGFLLLRSLDLKQQQYWFFLGIGLLSILAAITYTVGKKAYGYSGFGDLAVFLFFGIISVSGTHYLITKSFDPYILLPAASIGLLSTAVLNLNNLRDIENDTASSKNTLVVKMGFKAAKLYHTFLISLPVILSFLYVVANFESAFQFMFLLTAPILIKLSNKVKNADNPASLDPELKKQALTTLLFSITFALGQLL